MNVTIENGLISITEMTVTEAEVLLIASLNGAESRKSCEEPSRILRRLAMYIDHVLPNNTQPVNVIDKDNIWHSNHLFNHRNIKY